MRNAVIIVGDMRGLVKWLCKVERRSARARSDMLKRLINLGWIAGFVGPGVFWVFEGGRAARSPAAAGGDRSPSRAYFGRHSAWSGANVRNTFCPGASCS